MAYVCASCVEEHGLSTDLPHGHASCEVCGPLIGDWSEKFVIWAPQVYRYTGRSEEERKAQVEADLLWVKLRDAGPSFALALRKLYGRDKWLWLATVAKTEEVSA